MNKYFLEQKTRQNTPKGAPLGSRKKTLFEKKTKTSENRKKKEKLFYNSNKIRKKSLSAGKNFEDDNFAFAGIFIRMNIYSLHRFAKIENLGVELSMNFFKETQNFHECSSPLNAVFVESKRIMLM